MCQIFQEPRYWIRNIDHSSEIRQRNSHRYFQFSFQFYKTNDSLPDKEPLEPAVQLLKLNMKPSNLIYFAAGMFPKSHAQPFRKPMRADQGIQPKQ